MLKWRAPSCKLIRFHFNNTNAEDILSVLNCHTSRTDKTLQGWHETLCVWLWSISLKPGAIIGDGDRKRALILLLGLSPWYGTIFLFLEQIALSPVAHARICCEDFCVCHEGEMTSVITKMFDTFGPQQPTTQYVHVCWNFASVFSS